MLQDRETQALVGRTFDGLQLERLIGRGRQGVVFQAVRLADSRAVDVKLFHPYLTEVSGFEERFVRECRRAVPRRCANLQRVYGRVAVEAWRGLALEALAGQNLATWLAVNAAESFTGRCAMAAWLLPQVAAALGRLHDDGCTHGDMKPANLLLTADGRVVVADAGLAQVLYADDVPILIGDPHYMAPEQAGSEAPAEVAGDQYALAAVAFHLLAGEPVYDGPTPGNILRQQREQPVPSLAGRVTACPEALDQALARALAKAPGERFSSVSAFVAAVLTALPEPSGAVVLPSAQAPSAEEVPTAPVAEDVASEPPPVADGAPTTSMVAAVPEPDSPVEPERAVMPVAEAEVAAAPVVVDQTADAVPTPLGTVADQSTATTAPVERSEEQAKAPDGRRPTRAEGRARAEKSSGGPSAASVVATVVTIVIVLLTFAALYFILNLGR